MTTPTTEPAGRPADETPYQRIFHNNRAWAAAATRDDPEFFTRREAGQSPTFLFIGCSDSRVPAEMLTGSEPGEMFVHRNVANLAVHTDLNLLAVLHYAVDALKVQDVIVCGHYGCGGVKAAMGSEPHPIVDNWLRNIQNVMRLHEDALAALPDADTRYRRLVELNAMEQAYNVSHTPVVQAAWRRGQPLTVHAMVYSLHDGRLTDLGVSYSATGAVPDAHVSAWLEQSATGAAQA